MGGERERDPDLGCQFPGLRGRRRGEVGVEQLRPELAEGDWNLAQVVHRLFIQAGPSDELMAQLLRRPPQRQDAHLHPAPAHLGQLIRDKRLRDFWKYAEHVGHPKGRHASALRAGASERARSTTRSAFWSQVYRPWISLAAASPRRLRNVGSDSNRSQAASKALESPAGYSKPVSPSRITSARSEEHTSELQSPCNLVCRLLLEKKKKKI